MRRLLAVVGVAAVVVGLTGTPSLAATTNAEMKDNVFIPADISIAPGDTVRWENNGRSPHNVTTGDDSATSPNVEPGGMFEKTFDSAMTWYYYCSLHSTGPGQGMAGVVRVGSGGPVVGAPKATAGGPSTGGPQVRRVPTQFPTIQKAVDAAHPGDVVLISPGIYKETVKVTKPDLTIRGLDRNKVIIDGEFERAMGIIVQNAENVVVENLTVRYNTVNNIYWTGSDGYRGSYLTSYNSGDYGIYAFGSVNGIFEDSWASGSLDSGFYIGQCSNCKAVIRRVKASLSGLGYSGTNAGGDLVIADSEWFDNYGGGITPNTLDSEENPPQRGLLITGNYVHGNQNRDAPYKDSAFASVYGVGIALMGTEDDIVVGNRVEDHEYFGILVQPIPGLGPGAVPTGNIYATKGNQVRENTVSGSGLADIAMGAPAGEGNCFEDNDFGTSLPAQIETAYSCGMSLSAAGGGDPAVTAVISSNLARAESGELAPGDWKTQAVPPPQPNMPSADKVTFRPVGTPVGPTARDFDVLPRTGGTRPVTRYGLWLLAGSVLAAAVLALAGRRRLAA
jgi:plastocyanin